MSSVNSNNYNINTSYNDHPPLTNSTETAGNVVSTITETNGNSREIVNACNSSENRLLSAEKRPLMADDKTDAINHLIEERQLRARANFQQCTRIAQDQNNVTRETFNQITLRNNEQVKAYTLKQFLTLNPHNTMTSYIDHLLFDTKGQVIEECLCVILDRAPMQLTDAQIERALFNKNSYVRTNILVHLLNKVPERLTPHLIERCVLSSGSFDLIAFQRLPFTNMLHLDAMNLNQLSPEKIGELDGRLFSALPNDVLEELEAKVLNNLTDANKTILGLRVIARLSDAEFDKLDDRVLGLMEVRHNKYIDASMSSERISRIIKIRTPDLHPTSKQ